MKSIISIVSIFMATLLNATLLFAQTTDNYQEYQKFKNNDLGIVNLNTGKQFYYQVESREHKNQIEVVKATINDPQLPNFLNSHLIVTLDHEQEDMQGMIETSEGHYRVNTSPDADYVWEKTQPPEMLDEVWHDQVEKLSDDSPSDLMFNTLGAIKQQGETDASGRYVIEVFIGFSDKAAKDVGNINSTAQMYIESVNTALKNSKIDNVYLRLVGVGTSPENIGVVGAVLTNGKRWFNKEILRTKPDLVGFVQRPTGAPGSAGGWAGVGGRTHVISSRLPSAYRHEVGHNVGGVHCKKATDRGYRFGYSPRRGKGTIQCGNRLAYYSTPLVADAQGRVLGTAHSNDMARMWRQNAAKMSAYRKSVTQPPTKPPTKPPTQPPSQSPISPGTYKLKNFWLNNFIKNQQGVPKLGNIQSKGSSDWIFEKTGYKNYYRIRSRENSNLYLHIEYGKLELGPRRDNWHSAQWSLEFVTQARKRFRIKNRWKTNHYINVEKKVASAGPITKGWHSAMWKFLPVY